MGAIPMVIMPQSAANWRNAHIKVDRTHSLTHLQQVTSTQLQPLCAQLESIFVLEGT